MQITFSYGWGVRSDALTPALSHREREKGGGPLLVPRREGEGRWSTPGSPREGEGRWSTPGSSAGREKGGGPLLAPPQGGRRAVNTPGSSQGGRRAVVHSWLPRREGEKGGEHSWLPQGGGEGAQRKETTLFASVPFLSGIHLVQIASRFRRRMAGGQGGVDISWRHGVNDIRCLHLIA